MKKKKKKQKKCLGAKDEWIIHPEIIIVRLIMVVPIYK